MKTFKILLIAAGLLVSIQAMACNVHITVKNETGETLDAVMVTGPCYRESSVHSDLKNNSSFTYNATGSFCTCHGTYELDRWAGRPHCDINDSVKNTSVHFSSDGSATFTILEEKNGSLCKVALTKN